MGKACGGRQRVCSVYKTPMKTIGWIEIHLKKYGAIVYNDQARKALAQSGEFQVQLLDASSRWFERIRYLKIPEAFVRVAFLQGKRDVWVRDFYSVLAMSPRRTRGKQVAIMHHLDFSGFPLIARLPLSVLKRVFFRNLKHVDAIVVVSRYWERYFTERGYQHVRVIYNGFDISRFTIDDQEVAEFKNRHKLKGNPIVYLGNCQKPKGVVEAYEELKDLPVHLVTSGSRRVEIPAKNIAGDYHEYLVLLKASSVALVMSKFQEGWNRTAHEAMLCRTPVIGSGLGGMRELLEEGGQIVCEDFRDLKKHVEMLLQSDEMRRQQGERGWNFAKDFTLDRFSKEWVAFMKDVCA